MDASFLNHTFDILLVTGCVAASMGALTLYQRRTQPDPETVRKLMHVSSGALAAAFPWLFDATWAVLVVCTASLLGMIAVRYIKVLSKRCGSVLGGVSRRSLGEMYFPVAVGVLYVMSGGDRALYVIPVLVMTFADTAAALVGLRFGKRFFRTRDGRKSVEGCLAFFAAALPCVAIPLAIWTDASAEQIVYAALLVSVILMVIEAGSWAGIDNLAVPAVGFVLVRASLGVSVETLSQHAQSAVLLVGAMGFFCNITFHRLRTVAVRGVGSYWMPVILVITLVCLELVASVHRDRAVALDVTPVMPSSPSVASLRLDETETVFLTPHPDGTPSISWR